MALTRAFGVAACIAAVALLVAALLLGGRADAAEARVMSASVRLPTVAGRPAAGYLTLHAGAVPLTIVGADTPLAARIELHGSTTEAGVVRMSKLPMVRVLPGGTAAFAPGGSHLMVFGLRADVKPGATVPITLRLRGGATLQVAAIAVAAGAVLPDTHAGHGAH